jgi:hypothetical protein
LAFAALNFVPAADGAAAMILRTRNDDPDFLSVLYYKKLLQELSFRNPARSLKSNSPDRLHRHDHIRVRSRDA